MIIMLASSPVTMCCSAPSMSVGRAMFAIWDKGCSPNVLGAWSAWPVMGSSGSCGVGWTMEEEEEEMRMAAAAFASAFELDWSWNGVAVRA